MSSSLNVVVVVVVVSSGTGGHQPKRRHKEKSLAFYVLEFCFSISSFVRLFCLLVFLEGGGLSHSLHMIFPWFVKASAENE